MWFVLCIEQDVPRFDVSMQDAVLMRVMHSAGQLCNELHRTRDRHGLAFDYFVKLAAFNKLHAEVTRAFALTHFIDGNNAWMFEAGRGFRFAAKALQMRFIGAKTPHVSFWGTGRV